jgi:hypothetical protein
MGIERALYLGSDEETSIHDECDNLPHLSSSPLILMMVGTRRERSLKEACD